MDIIFLVRHQNKTIITVRYFGMYTLDQYALNLVFWCFKGVLV